LAKKALANAAAAGIGSAPAPRASKPSAKKTRTAASESVDTTSVAAVETASPDVLVTAPDAHQQIAEIAYRYWAARGYQGGSQAEDWLRAEQEYLAGLR
jgi:hypothetical protein